MSRNPFHLFFLAAKQTIAIIFKRLKEVQWDTLLIFIIISALYWFLLNMNHEYEINKTLLIRYETPQGNKLPDSIFTDTLRFSIRTQGWHLWKPDLNRKITLPLVSRQSENKKELIRHILIKKAGKKVKISHLQIIPNKNSSRYAIKRLPVILTYDLIPAGGYFIKKMIYQPKHVWAFGEKHIMDNVHEVKTVYQRISRIKNQKVLRPLLNYPAGVHGLTKKILLKIEALPYVRKNTIATVYLPDSLKKKIIIFPSQVKIFYKEYLPHKYNKRKHSKDQWLIGVEWNSKDGKKMLVPVVLKKPENTFGIIIEPDQLDYLIKQTP